MSFFQNPENVTINGEIMNFETFLIQKLQANGGGIMNTQTIKILPATETLEGLLVF